MSPEFWHRVAIKALEYAGESDFWKEVLCEVTRCDAPEVEAFRLKFPNRVGLAAGFDKGATAWRALSCLGFGHIEVGTVTRDAQKGNPKRPRIWKDSDGGSIRNSMGSPNPGMYQVAQNIQGAREELKGRTLLGANIGKSERTSLKDAGQEYADLIRVLGPHVDFITMNLSSPNTRSLQMLQHGSHLYRMLEKAMLARDLVSFMIGRHLPVLVKISPTLIDDFLIETTGVLVGYGVDGIVATNTLSNPLLVGGISGAPLRERSVKTLVEIKKAFPDVKVISVGGILSPQEALDRIHMGAELVQVYSGMIFEGPLFPSNVVRRCAHA